MTTVNVHTKVSQFTRFQSNKFFYFTCYFTIQIKQKCTQNIFYLFSNIQCCRLGFRWMLIELHNHNNEKRWVQTAARCLPESNHCCISEGCLSIVNTRGKIHHYFGTHFCLVYSITI